MQTVNLMPRDYARTERSKRRLIVSAAVTVAAVLAMFGLGRLTNQWVAQKERGNALLEGRVQELEVARAELASYNLTLQQLARKHSVIQTIGRNRRWASYLAHIAAAANGEVLLTRAHISPGAAEADDSPGPKKAGALTATPPAAEKPKEEADKVKPKKLVLLLEGYALSATDITKFISALSAPGLFERVTFKGSQMAQINRKPLSRFELECPIRYTPRRRRAGSPGKSRPAQAAPALEGPALLSSSPAPAEGGGE